MTTADHDRRPDECSLVYLDRMFRDRQALLVQLDAAYTRNVTERFDGLTHPPDHDLVDTFVDVWADLTAGEVTLTIPDAGIRLSISIESATALGCLLISEAARADRSPG